MRTGELAALLLLTWLLGALAGSWFWLTLRRNLSLAP
jgi:hypothetical protein